MLTLFVVTRKSDGAEVYRYTAQYPIEWAGYEFDKCVHTPQIPDEPTVAPLREWSIFEFMCRFTANERVAARIRAKDDPILEDFFALLNSASVVRSDNADVSAGLTYLQSLGILSSARADEILRGA